MIALTFVSGAYAQDDESNAKIWDWSSIPSADQTAMTADTKNWEYDSDKERYSYLQVINKASLTAGETALSCVKGLLFTTVVSNKLRLGYKSKCCLWMADNTSIIIPDAQKDKFIKVVFTTSSNGNSRTFTTSNLDRALPDASNSKTEYTGTAKVSTSGDVTITAPDGLYVYSLAYGDSVAIFGGTGGDSSGGGSSDDNPDNPNDQTHLFNYMTGSQEMKTVGLGTGPVLYVSPTGSDSNDGLTKDTPLASIQLAIDKALDPGTTIYLAAGEYRPTARININDRNGTSDNYNSLVCLDGRAVINCNHPAHSHSDNPYQGIRLTSSYWHFYHVDITNASDNGMLIERNKPANGTVTDIIARTQDAHDNIIEACNFYKNGDTGLQIKNLGSFNYILNCDSYENRDENDGDADGFAPKISVGDGNYFYGCRAYNNSDDGYDVFFKKDGGFTDNKTIVFENCLAYESNIINGTALKGNGNGFKCGSDQGAMNVVLNRCMAVNNYSKGFDQNHNSGDIIMNNCTGYSRKTVDGVAISKAYSYRAYEDIATGHELTATNCIAVNDNLTTDKHHSDASKWGADSKTYGRTELSVGTMTTCDLNVAPSNVVNEDWKECVAARDAHDDWDMSAINFLRPVEGNALLVDKGTAVAENTKYASSGVKIPAIQYVGEAPDLGALENGLSIKNVKPGFITSGIGYIESSESDGKSVHLVQAFNGMVIVNVTGAQAKDVYTVSAVQMDGKLLGRHQFNGTNTSIYLPNVKGIILLKVSGKGVNETVKTLMR